MTNENNLESTETKLQVATLEEKHPSVHMLKNAVLDPAEFDNPTEPESSTANKENVPDQLRDNILVVESKPSLEPAIQINLQESKQLELEAKISELMAAMAEKDINFNVTRDNLTEELSAITAKYDTSLQDLAELQTYPVFSI